MAPTHYLKQCWLIKEFLWHAPESNFTVSAQATTASSIMSLIMMLFKIIAKSPRDQLINLPQKHLYEDGWWALTFWQPGQRQPLSGKPKTLKYHKPAVFALTFENLLAQNSSMKIFKHEKEEKLAGPTWNFAGPAPFLVAKGLGPALNAKTEPE